MKKIHVICMILSLFAGLIGCTQQKTASWESLTYHVTSSVQAEGCHFSLTREESGAMTLTGYCFADGSEHRLEEAKAVSRETADAIGALELDKAATERQKLFAVADGTQITVTLGYADGTQRRIRLSAQQQAALKQLLQEELVGLLGDAAN